MTLDNREWALAIWIAIALFGILRSSKLRDASAAVLRALAQRSIVITFLLLFAYIALIVATLRHFGLWEVTNLKTTLIWALGSACIAIFNVQKVEDEQRFFRSALGEIIGVAVVVDFLTAIDTFPLWVEFLIAGSLLFLGGLSAVSAKEPSQRRVHSGANALLIIFGVLMLAKSIYHIAVDFGDFANARTLREFLLPIALGFLLLPFLFALSVYLIAESVLIGFRHQSKSATLTRYAGFRLLHHLGLDMPAWRQWQRHAGRFSPRTPDDVDASIAEIKRTRSRQKNPYRVHPVVGWLPEAAMGFLEAHSLRTRPYYRVDEKEWTAASNMTALEDGARPNNVSYYISGDSFTVKELRLKLNVNQPESPDVAIDHFAELCNALLRKALPFALPLDRPFELEVGQVATLGGHQLSLTRNDWPGGIKGGFDLSFIVKIPARDCANESEPLDDDLANER